MKKVLSLGWCSGLFFTPRKEDSWLFHSAEGQESGRKLIFLAVCRRWQDKVAKVVIPGPSALARAKTRRNVEDPAFSLGIED